MIVFVAPFPGMMDERDGFAQRIAWIDSLVGDKPRIYLEISFRRFWSVQRYSFGKVTVFQVNGLSGLFFIFSLLGNASVIYVHSVYGSLKVIPAYFFSNIITDLHGVVPEELAYLGKKWQARLFGLVEWLALRRSRTVVYVTSNMQRHFKLKYGRSYINDRNVAILPKLTDARGCLENVLASKRDPSRVIYAGGLQDWQNVPMMMQAAAKAPELNFIFLSGEALVLQRLADSENIKKFSCASVRPDQVPDYYLESTYGFILRDPVLLNRVACPTKLVEYMHWGVVPIVLTPDIGDFSGLGFSFVTLDDFCAGRLPGIDALANMRAINRRIAEGLLKSCDGELLKLIEDLNGN